MSLQFKFKDSVAEDRRREVIAALEGAGFAAKSLFPTQKRSQLSSIFTLSDAEAKDLKAVRNALTSFRGDIEYVEAAPARTLKAPR